MTREQKLALVLGFAAVLIVGLLVSDHLAAARSAKLDEAPHDSTVVVDATEGQALRRVVALPIPTQEPQEEYRGRRIQRLAQAEPDPSETSPIEPHGETAENAETAETVAMGGYGSTLPYGADPAPAPVPALEPEPIVLRNSSDGGIEMPGEQQTVIGRLGEQVANGLSSIGRQIEDLANGAGQNAPAALGAIGSGPRAAESRTVRVSPVVVQHHVQANESLYKIAEQYFGDGNKWRTIAKANEGRVGEDGSVRVGVTLRIIDPTRGVEQARPQPRATQVLATDAAASRPAPDASGGPMTYTVQRGDTLGEISQKLLGTVRRQHELIALNRQLLKDPDQLRAGMVLKLPSS